MLTRRIRGQLAVFAVIAVVAVTVMASSYVQLPQLLGFGQFTVRADFEDASGLYAGALVNERGIDVGKVDSLDLRPDGVDVVLRINDDTRIAKDAVATIRSTSAIGEQYVELVAGKPERGQGVLRDGSRIPRNHTRGMPQVAPLFNNLDALLRTVPRTELTGLLKDLSTGLGGTGGYLQRLLDSSSRLVRAAQANLGPTRGLLNSLGPVLDTQTDLASQTTTWTRNLSSFTAQLVRSNDDIKTLLDRGPGFADQFTSLTGDLKPTLPVVLDNLVSVGQVLQVYRPGVEQLLVIYPALVAAIQSALLPQQATKEAQLSFRLNLNDPPPCITGFIPVSQRRDPSVVVQGDTPTDIYCKVKPSDPRSVRGARNAECLNAPGNRAASVQQCLGGSASATTRQTARSTGTTATVYDPTSRVVATPGDTTFRLGSTMTSGRRPATWQQLVTIPITR